MKTMRGPARRQLSVRLAIWWWRAGPVSFLAVFSLGCSVVSRVLHGFNCEASLLGVLGKLH